MLNRRTFVRAAAWSATSVAMPTLWAQPRLEKTRISIAAVGKAAVYHLPLTIAEQLGYFKAEGLMVEINDFFSDALAAQAVAAGSADVVAGAYQHTISLQSHGQQCQAFVLQGRAPAIAMGIAPKTLPYYDSLADLKGKIIGISTLGSSTHTVANLVLARAGLRVDDVRYVGVGSAAGALNALRSGEIDAISNVDPVISMLEQKGEIRLVADTRTLKGTQEVFGGPMPAGCLYAPLEFIQKNHNTVQALTHAMTRSLKWLQTAGPSDLIKTIPEAYLLGDRALYLAAFSKGREAISPDGMMIEDGPRNAVRVLARFDPSIKSNQIELSKTYTNEFARAAKERLKA